MVKLFSLWGQSKKKSTKPQIKPSFVRPRLQRLKRAGIGAFIGAMFLAQADRGLISARALAQESNKVRAVSVSAGHNVRLQSVQIRGSVIDAEFSRVKDSPLIGLGDKMVEWGRKYGVDPVFALSVFAHESNYGTRGLGAKNNNPGNIRWVKGMKWKENKGFVVYPSMEEGACAFFRAIANDNNYFKRGRFTVEEIIPVWAPSSENNTAAYIKSVTNTMNRVHLEMQKAVLRK